MRIIGWPEQPDADNGILPVTITEVDFHGTPDELRTIGEFLLKAAAELGLAQTGTAAVDTGIELSNSNPQATVGVWVNVVRHVDE